MTKQSNTTSDATHKKELRGTFYSVLTIGALVTLFWVVMLIIYLQR
jgi:hypothetical protein